VVHNPVILFHLHYIIFIYLFILLCIYLFFILLNRYVLEDHNRDAGLKLRQVIADVVKSGTLFDPTPKRVGPSP
jgi:hypothetical protein